MHLLTVNYFFQLESVRNNHFLLGETETPSFCFIARAKNGGTLHGVRPPSVQLLRGRGMGLFPWRWRSLSFQQRKIKKILPLKKNPRRPLPSKSGFFIIKEKKGARLNPGVIINHLFSFSNVNSYDPIAASATIIAFTAARIAFCHVSPTVKCVARIMMISAIT